MTNTKTDKRIDKRLVRNSIEWIGGNQIKVIPPANPYRITGTWLAAVTGEDQYRTPFEAFLSMTRTYDKPFTGNKYTNAGKHIEPKQISYAETNLRDGYSIVRPTDIYGPDPFHATWGNFFQDDTFGGMWDALVKRGEDTTHVIECKTAYDRTKWKTGAPENYRLQAGMYAALLGCDHFCLVASFLTQGDYNCPDAYVCTPENTSYYGYSIQRDMPWLPGMMDSARGWYQRHVRTGISPVYDEVADGALLTVLREVDMPTHWPRIDAMDCVSIPRIFSEIHDGDPASVSRSYNLWMHRLLRERGYSKSSTKRNAGQYGEQYVWTR